MNHLKVSIVIERLQVCSRKLVYRLGNLAKIQMNLGWLVARSKGLSVRLSITGHPDRQPPPVFFVGRDTEHDLSKRPGAKERTR